MSNWEPRTTSDKRTLRNAVQRHILRFNKENRIQDAEIIKLFKKYELGKQGYVEENKWAALEDRGDYLSLHEFEYIGKADSGKNIFNILIAALGKDGILKNLIIAEEENSANLNQFKYSAKGKSILRVSPYGGPSEVSHLNAEEVNFYSHYEVKWSNYKYVNNEDGFFLSSVDINHDNNIYYLTYSEKSGDICELCAQVNIFKNGEIESFFRDEKAFKGVCSLYKPYSLSIVVDNCKIYYLDNIRRLV